MQPIIICDNLICVQEICERLDESQAWSQRVKERQQKNTCSILDLKGARNMKYLSTHI